MAIQRVCNPPLYDTKVNKNAGPFPMQLGSRGSLDMDKDICISRRAVDFLGGTTKIYYILHKGISLVDNSRDLEQLDYLSLRNGKGVYKLIVHRPELDQLSTHFNVPSGILKDNFFVINPPGNAFTSTALKLAPRWDELLEPEWRTSYLAWLKDPSKNPLPSPTKFYWKTFKSQITFPGLPQALFFNNNLKEDLPGVLSLQTVNGEPQAFFFNNGSVRRYLLYPIVKYWGMTTEKKNKKEEWDPTSFQKLFGSKPLIVEYFCSKVSGVKDPCVSFGNVGGLNFTIEGALNNKFKVGRKYFFLFKRDGPSLRIVCFSDNEQIHPIGCKVISLGYGGFTNSTYFALDPIGYVKKTKGKK